MSDTLPAAAKQIAQVAIASPRTLKKNPPPNPTTMDNLPKDITARIASLVAEQSPDPMKDLRRLRSTSSAMKRTCSEREVGRSINLERAVRQRSWSPPYTTSEARTLTVNLAKVGNPWACFSEGMRSVFVEHRDDDTAGRALLEVAASGGHQIARYVLAMLLYRGNTGTTDDLRSMELLRRVEGDEDADKHAWTNQACTMMLEQAQRSLQPMHAEADGHQWRVHLAHPELRTPPQPCSVAGCGSDCGWHGWRRTSTFCSQACRIHYEYIRFRGCWW